MTVKLNPTMLSAWGSGKLIVNLTGITQPTTIRVASVSGQVGVSPSSQTVTPTATSAIAEFKLQAKKKSGSLTVSGPCGVQAVNVPVR
jgi:hypothetical protein